MSGTARINHHQLGSAVVIATHVATVLYMPAPLADVAGPDAWLAVPLGALLGGLPVAFMLSRLAVYHPHRSIGDIAERSLGRWLGKLITLVFATFCLFLASLVLRNVIDFAVIAFLPGTPMWAIGVLLALVATYAVYHGAEVVVRITVLIMFTTALGVLFLPVGIAPEIQLLRMLPILGKGVAPLVKATWMTSGWFAEVSVFAAWIGLIDKPRKSLVGLVWGLFGAAGLLTIVVISSLVTFGAELTRRLTFPAYTLAQEISLAELLERMELILMTVWLSGMVMKLCICLWSGTTATASVLGLRTDRWLIIPAAALVLAGALAWPSISFLIFFGTVLWTPFTLPISMGIPALLVIASWLRRVIAKGQAA